MAIEQACSRKSALATSLSFPCTRGGTRILGRKRVAVSPAPSSPGGPYSPVRALRKQRSTRLHMDGDVSLLESLPEDVLIKVLCKVNHSDLRQLFLVSTTVREATIVATEVHFAFATPSAKTGFRDEECVDDDDELQCAPKQRRVAGRSRPGGRDVAGISKNLAAAFDSLVSEA